MRTIRVVGELLITFGLVLLLFCAYELWGTSLYTQRKQAALTESLQRKWHPRSTSSVPPGPVASEPPYRYPKVPVGRTFAVLRIPEFGTDYHFAVVQGAGAEQLKKGPGHYLGEDGTAMPGQLGNFVVSGHRTTYLAPFEDIDELEPGDPIIIETDDTWFIYEVTRKDIVRPTDVEVAAPVPFHPGKRPTERRITLTTCHPKYTARRRLIVFGKLADAQSKTVGKPAVLTGTQAGQSSDSRTG